MNLQALLEQLESQVVDNMTKSASEKSEETGEVVETPALNKEFTKSAEARQEAEELGARVALDLLKEAEAKTESEESKEEKAKKDEDKAEDKKEDSEKSESEEEKKEESKEENMDKKASLVDIITGLLEKSALEGDANTAAGVADGAVPNKAQVDSAAMVADMDAVQAPTPGTDGVSQGGTVNQILDAIVAKAQAQGAIAPVQGAEGSAAAAERNDEDVEKTAAVVALVEAGVDFDSAVGMVKQAEAELFEEAWEQEKKAAFDTLIDVGVDFNDAVELVKEAAEEIEKQATGATDLAKAIVTGKMKGMGRVPKELVRGTAAQELTAGAKRIAKGKVNQVTKAVNSAKGSVAQYAADVGADAGDMPKLLKQLVLDKGVKGLPSGVGAVRGNAWQNLKANKAARIAAGTTAAAGAAGAGYAAYQHQKKAAVESLIEEGFDFDSAVELVKQASEELYGE